MPTPFMHLQLSDKLHALACHRRDFDPNLLEVINEQWSAYYLGSVAPDYQSICEIPRSKTHFYNMPPQSESQAEQNMLARYPDLYPGKSLKPDQAMFVAAYSAHLQLDLIWHFEVALPYFLNSTIFEDHHQAYLIHVMLLTYLDNLAFQALPDTAANVLNSAVYDHWLPFAGADEINNWRDYLVEQMVPGRPLHTMQIFASRLRMTVDEFSAKLNDPEWMDKELFSRIPVATIQRRLQESVPESLELVEAYWVGRLG